MLAISHKQYLHWNIQYRAYHPNGNLSFLSDYANYSLHSHGCRIPLYGIRANKLDSTRVEVCLHGSCGYYTLISQSLTLCKS